MAQIDLRFIYQLAKAAIIRQVYRLTQDLQGQRPVHRAGIEVNESELLRQTFGQSAFAGSRRPVDGNNQPIPLWFGPTILSPCRYCKQICSNKSKKVGNEILAQRGVVDLDPVPASQAGDGKRHRHSMVGETAHRAAT